MISANVDYDDNSADDVVVVLLMMMMMMMMAYKWWPLQLWLKTCCCRDSTMRCVSLTFNFGGGAVVVSFWTWWWWWRWKMMINEERKRERERKGKRDECKNSGKNVYNSLYLKKKVLTMEKKNFLLRVGW